ncbi:DUF4385 family protein, partial [Salmonella enterica]
VPAYGPQNDVTLKMPAFEWVHVQLHQQKGMISLSPPTICNSARGNDPIKAAAATVFKGWWDKIRQDEDYLKRKRQHQARWG